MIHLFPNPSHGALNVVINQEFSGTANIKIVDILGQVVFSREYPVAAGIQQIQLDIGYLAPALYTVIAESGEYRITEKIVRGN